MRSFGKERVSGGDLIADVLVRHGVRFVFTLCGGHISPILVSAKARGIRVVDTRHEATAVFAADAVARLTGVPGVAAVTAGPGVTNTITAIKNAQMAESPLVLLGGAPPTLLRGRGALQDIDQMALVRPHVKRAERVGRVRDLAPALERALSTCLEGVRGPVFVECPLDVLYPAEIVREWYGAKALAGARTIGERVTAWYVRRHVERILGGGTDAGRARVPAAPGDGAPSTSHVARARALVEGAVRPVVLVGSQAMTSPARVPGLREALEAIGAPVFLSGMARGLLGPTHPLQMRHRRREALREADLVVLAGVSCDFRLDYGRHIGRRARIVSANRNPREIARNRRPTVAVPGAPELTLGALAAALPKGGRIPSWPEWTGALRARDEEREEQIRKDEETDAPGGVNPLALCRGIEAALVDDSVVVADGGDFVATASYVLRPRRPLSWLDPGPFGTLGVGAGFALGARLVRPEADVFIIYGDGSVGYSLAEADTFARHGLGVVAVIGNDAGWTQIARDQVEVLKDDVATTLAPTAYERAAEGMGAAGLSLVKGDSIGPVLDEARRLAREGRPVYVNARIGKTDFRKGSISM